MKTPARATKKSRHAKTPTPKARRSKTQGQNNRKPRTSPQAMDVDDTKPASNHFNAGNQGSFAGNPTASRFATKQPPTTAASASASSFGAPPKPSNSNSTAPGTSTAVPVASKDPSTLSEKELEKEYLRLQHDLNTGGSRLQMLLGNCALSRMGLDEKRFELDRSRRESQQADAALKTSFLEYGSALNEAEVCKKNLIPIHDRAMLLHREVLLRNGCPIPLLDPLTVKAANDNSNHKFCIKEMEWNELQNKGLAKQKESAFWNKTIAGIGENMGPVWVEEKEELEAKLFAECLACYNDLKDQVLATSFEELLAILGIVDEEHTERMTLSHIMRALRLLSRGGFHEHEHFAARAYAGRNHPNQDFKLLKCLKDGERVAKGQSELGELGVLQIKKEFDNPKTALKVLKTVLFYSPASYP